MEVPSSCEVEDLKEMNSIVGRVYAVYFSAQESAPLRVYQGHVAVPSLSYFVATNPKQTPPQPTPSCTSTVVRQDRPVPAGTQIRNFPLELRIFFRMPFCEAKLL
jgi:hypothetical protein